jgi:hypothetical protein
MVVKGGLFGEWEKPVGRGREKGECNGGVNMIEVHYTYV